MSTLMKHNRPGLNIPSPRVVFPECTQFILGEVKDVVGFLSDEIIQKESGRHRRDIAILIFDSREHGTGH